MAQLNLLPSVKLEYVKAQSRKRTVIGLCAIVSGVFLAIFILLLLYVRVWQHQYMKAIDSDIDESVATLKQNPQLDEILTVQNQLNSLPDLHNKKNISSRTFDYLNKVTPKEATISDVALDFDAGTLNIKGKADSLKTVNKFADALKFTKFTVEGKEGGPQDAFKDVVLKDFSVTNDSQSGEAIISYEIEMKFDPAIYSNSAPSNEGKSPVVLTVPNIISTRSATQNPDKLFEEQSNNGGQQ